MSARSVCSSRVIAIANSACWMGRMTENTPSECSGENRTMLMVATLQNPPPRRGEYIRRQPFKRAAGMQQQPSARLLAILGAERTQVRGVGQSRARRRLHFDRQ